MVWPVLYFGPKLPIFVWAYVGVCSKSGLFSELFLIVHNCVANVRFHCFLMVLQYGVTVVYLMQFFTYMYRICRYITSIFVLSTQNVMHIFLPEFLCSTCTYIMF